jgi:hypothetical protein
MSACSIHPSGKAEWIACMRASLAKTSALLAEARVSMASEAAFIAKSFVSLTWFDRDSSSWRTLRQSFDVASEPFSGTWPRAGMMRDGQCWPLPMWERITFASGGGALRGERKKFGRRVARPPTPTKHEFLASEQSVLKRLEKHGRVSITLAIWLGGPPNPEWVEWYMGWPIGWTAAAPSETDKSHSALQPLGSCSADLSESTNNKKEA